MRVRIFPAQAASGLTAVLTAALLVLLTAGTGLAQNYNIRPGDTLQIEVLEDPSLNRSALVLPDGTISLPFIGTLKASGRSVEAVRRQVTQGLASNFAADPTVVVSVASLAAERPAPPAPPPVEPTIDLYIMGEVAQAGKKEVSPGTTILQFLAESGGLTPFAATSRIQLHRTRNGKTEVYLFSYDGKGKGTRIPPSTQLAEGDVVVVPARKLFE